MRTFTHTVVPTMAFAAAIFCQPASAQTPFGAGPRVETGDELLVVWYDPFWTASVGLFETVRRARLDLVRLDSRQLVGRDRGHTYFIETSSLRSLQRRVGTKPASAPAMVAASAGGFAAAFLVGAVVGSSGGGDGINTGLSSGVLVGAPLGAIVAWIASRSRGIYESVPVPSAGF